MKFQGSAITQRDWSHSCDELFILLFFLRSFAMAQKLTYSSIVNITLEELDDVFVSLITDDFDIPSESTVWQAACILASSVGYVVNDIIYLIDTYGSVNGALSIDPSSLPENFIYANITEAIKDAINDDDYETSKGCESLTISSINGAISTYNDGVDFLKY